MLQRQAAAAFSEPHLAPVLQAEESGIFAVIVTILLFSMRLQKYKIRVSGGGVEQDKTAAYNITVDI